MAGHPQSEPSLLEDEKELIPRKVPVEIALEVSEERFQRLAAYSPDLIYCYRLIPNRKFEFVSPAAEAITGYTPEEYYADPQLEDKIIYPEDRWKLDGPAESRLACEPAVLRWVRKDGSLAWTERREFPVYDEDGHLVAVEGIARDITHSVLAQAELAEKAEELARSNAELEQFAYIASHDLQEPLRIISSFLQLLKNRYQGRLGTDADDFINYAVEGAGRMQRQINDLLIYSRVGRHGKKLEKVSVLAALEQAVLNLSLLVEENGASISCDPLPEVLADDQQLVQMFQNLIHNAIKFRSQKPPEIHIGISSADGEWIFSVQDNGIGIDPKFFQRIFVIFQRLHMQDEIPGTGIGLAICKKIAERHGGRIWVESRPGEGSTFIFTLPQVEDDGSQHIQARDPSLRSG